MTSRNLEKGDIIAIYSGTTRHIGWDSSNQVGNKAYFINHLFVDADSGGGSLAELINHGFPNCAAYPHSYRGFPVLVMIALESLPAGATLYYDYGKRHFENLGTLPITLNPKGIESYLQETKYLRKVPVIDIFSDGLKYFSIDRGQVIQKETKVKATLSQAMDAMAHTTKISYLAGHHLEEMKKKLDKPTLKLLVNNFKDIF